MAPALPGCPKIQALNRDKIRRQGDFPPFSSELGWTADSLTRPFLMLNMQVVTHIRLSLSQTSIG
jgi:hypothetical protein